MTASTPRRIPGRAATCARCRAPIVWARALATQSGAGGKAMPLDPVEDPAGNVACRPVNDRGGLVARVLLADETPDSFTELRAMPHFATCPGEPGKPNPRLPDDVADLAAHRERRRTSGR